MSGTEEPRGPCASIHAVSASASNLRRYSAREVCSAEDILGRWREHVVPPSTATHRHRVPFVVVAEQRFIFVEVVMFKDCLLSLNVTGVRPTAA